MRRRDDEKQQRIKEAVMHLILREGFAGTSISKIAREAGVSPATVYIYYESKESMLQEIYTEYSDDVFGYLMSRVDRSMSTAELISALMRSYYTYIGEHEEIFSFVDQFSHCPSLACKCSGQASICTLFELMREQMEEGRIRPYSENSLAAVIFYPVNAIAMEHGISEEERQKQLAEVIEIIQRAIII